MKRLDTNFDDNINNSRGLGSKFQAGHYSQRSFAMNDNSFARACRERSQRDFEKLSPRA